MIYSKYKIYIESLFLNIVGKKKGKKSKQMTTDSNSITVTLGKNDTASVQLNGKEVLNSVNVTKEKPHGHFEGVNWVWPNGQKTHVRFIDIAIRKMKPLPRGFYEEAEKETYLTNMKAMLRKAKQLKLPDSVDIRNEEE